MKKKNPQGVLGSKSSIWLPHDCTGRNGKPNQSTIDGFWKLVQYHVMLFCLCQWWCTCPFRSLSWSSCSWGQWSSFLSVTFPWLRELHTGTPGTAVAWFTFRFSATLLSHGGPLSGVCQPQPRPILSYISLGHLSRLPLRVILRHAVSLPAIDLSQDHWSSSEIPVDSNFTKEENDVGIFAKRPPEEPISKTPSDCQGPLAGAANTLPRKRSSCSPSPKGTRGAFPEQFTYIEK